MKLEHEDGEKYRPNKVTVHYDNKIRNLEVNEKGQVEVENKLEAKELQESHGRFKAVEGEENDLPDYVLADKNVNEVRKYIRDIEDINRLKELREKEDRKTAVQHIDNRISDVKEKQPIEAEYEEIKDENQDEPEEESSEDGEETEE